MTTLHVNIAPGEPRLPNTFSFKACSFAEVEGLAKLLKVTSAYPMQLYVVRVPALGTVVLVEVRTSPKITQAMLRNTMRMLPGSAVMEETLRDSGLFADLLRRTA